MQQPDVPSEEHQAASDAQQLCLARLLCVLPYGAAPPASDGQHYLFACVLHVTTLHAACGAVIAAALFAVKWHGQLGAGNAALAVHRQLHQAGPVQMCWQLPALGCL